MSNTTNNNIATARIEALRVEAGAAGDYETVQHCDMVLLGEYLTEQGDDETLTIATDAEIAEARASIAGILA